MLQDVAVRAAGIGGFDNALSGYNLVKIELGQGVGVVVGLGDVKVVDLLPERHLVHEVMIRRLLPDDVFPRDGVQEVEEAGVEDQKPEHKAHVVSQGPMQFCKMFVLF